MRAPLISLSKALHKVSKMSDDFPPPETPVTQVNVPRGILTSTFFKLLVFAPINSINLPLPLRRVSGISIFFAPLRY